MNEREVPTPGQLATLCLNCGVRPRQVRRGSRGPAPRYCEQCREEVTRRSIREYQQRWREDPEHRVQQATYFASRAPYARSTTHRKVRYGLSHSQIRTWLAFQGWLCALCQEPLGKRFDVDHDHDTGFVRGMLHHACNTLLEEHPNAERYKAGWV